MILQERFIVLAVVFTMALGLSLTLTPGVLLPYGLALGVLASVAVPYLLHGLPGYRFSVLQIVLPAAIAVAAPAAAHGLAAGLVQLLGVFGPGALLYGVILAEATLIRGETEQSEATARLVLSLATYVVALAIFLLLYQLKERALISAPAAGAASLALCARLLALDGKLDRRAGMCAVVAGLAVAEVLWPLNYWVLGALGGGLALLLAFYVAVGVVRQLLDGPFTQALALEWGGVSLAGLAVVYGASRL